MAEHLVRRAAEGNVAAVHNDDAAAVLGEQGDLLLDDDDGHAQAFVRLAQRLEDEARASGVECGGGLVEDEDARLERQDGGDGDLLLLAAGQRRDLAIAEIGDTHGLERGRDTSLDLVVQHAEVFEAEQHLVLHDGRDHLCVDVLEHAADDARNVRQGDVAGIPAVDERRAEELAGEVMRDGAAHDGSEGGLAGA